MNSIKNIATKFAMQVWTLPVNMQRKKLTMSRAQTTLHRVTYILQFDLKQDWNKAMYFVSNHRRFTPVLNVSPRAPIEVCCVLMSAV